LVSTSDLSPTYFNGEFEEFGFYLEFCYVVTLYLRNILIITNFDILKYIKKIFKISI